MNAIVPFNFNDQPIRIEDRAGQPWFVLADVCRVLGLSNVGDAAARVREAERDEIALTDAIGRAQSVVAVNEAGLYRLIMRSRKPAAEQFSDWVVGDVLPSIRQTGSYGAPAPALDLRDPATLHRLLIDHTGLAMAAEARAAALAPKADAFDRLTDTGGALGVREASKALKMGQQELVDWLLRNNWAFREKDRGRLQGYRVRLDSGLVAHETTRVPQPSGPDRIATSLRITAKGLARIAETLEGRS